MNFWLDIEKQVRELSWPNYNDFICIFSSVFSDYCYRTDWIDSLLSFSIPEENLYRNRNFIETVPGPISVSLFTLL